MCQNGTCRRFKHATKDYFTILISEKLQIFWTDIGYHRYFSILSKTMETEGSDFTDHNRINHRRLGGQTLSNGK
jgi:hypothetical protein